MTITQKEIQVDYKNRINRVFKFITEETLNEYVTRRRIEKSALDLLHKNITTTEIAHKYGFSDNSSFSRAFKKSATAASRKPLVAI